METIGDCYFCCSGIPVERSDHAQALVCMALDMQAALRTRGWEACRALRLLTGGRFKRPDGEDLQIRVGIHSGPVIAGVVGAKCPRMHLFGPNVQRAEEMEQGGVPDRVNVSHVTKQLLEASNAPFQFESRFDEGGDTRTDMFLVQRGDGIPTLYPGYRPVQSARNVVAAAPGHDH